MIVETVIQTRTSSHPWFNLDEYRFWPDRAAYLKREGRLLENTTVVEETPTRRVLRRVWNTWEDYFDLYFNVGTRSILGVLERTEALNGIHSRTEVKDVL